ncbi:MAG: hypothetical protein ACE5IT_06110 [bacterium]
MRRFHNRAIKDEYVCLILDRIFLNAKSPAMKKRRCILAAYGIERSGRFLFSRRRRVTKCLGAFSQ